MRTVTAHGVYCMPGGTFQEVAVWQGALDRYLDRARELGFNAIEVSDGTIEMDRRTRADAIAKAVKAGFRVLSEVGKKDPADAQPMAALAEIVNADLDGGAFMVIMEAREAGKGVGIYDASGLPKEAEIEAFLAGRARSRPDPLGGAARAPAAVPRPPVRSQRQPGQRRARGRPRPRGAPLRAPGRHAQARVARLPGSRRRRRRLMATAPDGGARASRGQG